MRSKQTFYVTLVIALLLLIAIILYLSNFVQPKMSFTAQIGMISEEDYQRIKNNAGMITAGKAIEEFRGINLLIKISALFPFINHINIGETPFQGYFMQPYLKDNTKIVILGGGSFGSGSNKEFSEHMTVFLKDISESELRNILGDLRIEVSWQNIWNKKDSEIFYLKDYLR